MSIVRSRIYSTGAAAAYSIANSVVFNDDDGAYLSRTFTTPTNNKIFTYSAWAKRAQGFDFGGGTLDPSIFSAPNGANQDGISWGEDSTDRLRVYFDSTSGGYLRTTQVFRDCSAWFHLVVAVDTTQATAANRVKIYLNGAQVTSFETATYPTQNYNPGFNAATSHKIGKMHLTTRYFDGMLSDVYFIDGQALTAADFGETNGAGVWVPKAYSGTYGTNGFHLDFANSADLGNDVSGNNNDWTNNNLTSTDQVTDTPTSNYCVFNVLDQSNSGAVISEGNLGLMINDAAADTLNIRATHAISSGKWYWEWEVKTISTQDNYNVGIRNIDEPITSTWKATANKDYGRATTDGIVTDVYGCALDFTAGAMWFHKNGTWDNGATTGEVEAGTTTNAVETGIVSGSYAPVYADQSGTSTAGCLFNFGQRSFAYTAPSGFSSLSASKLPAPDVSDSSSAFTLVKDTGANIESTASSARSGWSSYIEVFKNVDTTSTDWQWRFSDDTSNTLKSNSNAAKVSFTAPSGADDFVCYLWRVGGAYGCYTAEISHTNGADTNQAHGLGTGRKVAIAKISNTTGNWFTVHPYLSSGYNIDLNSTNGEYATVNVSVDNTNVTVKSGAATGTYRVIVWEELAGVSSFNEYTGNGSGNGPTAITALNAPAMHIIKYRNSSGFSWAVTDNVRSPNNLCNLRLFMDASAANNVQDTLDHLACGVKLRTTNTNENTSGGKFITIAFAEHPFGGNNVAPATAR